MHAIFLICYLALGAVQFFAIIAGLQLFGLHWLLASFVAMLVTYVPIVGSAAGVYGAVNAWDFTLLQGLALFFGPLVLIALLAFMMAGAATVSDKWKKRQSS